MVATLNDTGTIVRTDRGLTIAGTRITLYDVMDYYASNYPTRFIGFLFDLPEATIQMVIEYIDENRSDVDIEYQQVLQDAKQLEQSYRDRQPDLVAQTLSKPPKSGMEAAWEKLRLSRESREH
jgi:uncharacterized protein (DUF433 family)